MNKQIKLSFNVLSKYRTLLMGLTIISIIIFHYTEDCVKNSYNLKPIIVNYKTYIGSCGVDIFLFLSGLGLYYSFKKNPNIKQFFKKRFSKILIPYLIISIPAWYIKDILLLKTSWIQYFKDVLFISFFESGYKWFWYILMIMICYLIFPYIFTFIDGHRNFIKMICILIVITLLGKSLQLYYPALFKNVNIALLRFPAFFLGCFIGKKSYHNNDIPKSTLLLVVLSFLLMRYKSSMGILYSRYVLGLFGIVIITLIAVILYLINIKAESLKEYTWFKIIEWFGTHSLELYLTHVAIRGIMLMQGFPTYRIRYECVLIVLSIISSYLLKKICNHIT